MARNPATGPRDIQLARFSTFLLDDRDVVHDLVPPADNPDVAVPADSRVQATLAFEEPIADDARSVHVDIEVDNPTDPSD